MKGYEEGQAGRVVHIAGPHTTSTASADNPYHLPAGEQYYVVHAEMMMQHRWAAA